MGKRERTSVLIGIVLLLIAAQGVAIGQVDPNLVAWWQFDEGSGTTAFDSSGNGNDASFAGAPQWVGDGRFGKALQFDGVADYVAAPDSESLDINGDKLTLAAWMNGTSWATSHVVRKIADTGTGSVYMLRVQANVLRAIMSTSAGELSVEGVTQPSTGEWIHVALVYDGAEVRVYVNGAVDGRGDIAGPVVESNNEVRIGRGEPAGYFNGMIDDVRIYNRALTDDEIKALDPPKLQAYKPDPADGDLAVVVALLQWTAGDTAAFHDVYVGTDPNLGPDDLVQSRTPMSLYYHMSGLAPGTTYFWRVDEIEADMATVHTGEVWSFLAQPATAYQPDPADGANEVSGDPNMVLTWWSGLGAAEHHVYFGDNLEDVSAAAQSTDKGVLEEATFGPGPLDPLTTYYWRVDEIAPAGSVETGAVWQFTTYLPVDDFESYTDEEGGRIYETWVDGWTNGTGSVVGYLQAPFAEQTIVHGGRQSMPLDYNNVVSPFYSEVEREFAPTQDWTARGADTLVLSVRGRPTNGSAPLYVVVEDTAQHTGVAVHSDPAVVARGTWTEWQVPLSQFADAGVNLARVKKLYVGLGDRDAPSAGGSGMVYIDDVYLTRP